MHNGVSGCSFPGIVSPEGHCKSPQLSLSRYMIGSSIEQGGLTRPVNKSRASFKQAGAIFSIGRCTTERDTQAYSSSSRSPFPILMISICPGTDIFLWKSARSAPIAKKSEVQNRQSGSGFMRQISSPPWYPPSIEFSR